jgi:tetratricopeptide (TPR) repeat protein
MVNRLIIDVDDGGSVTVRTWLGDDAIGPAVSSPAPLSWPMDDSAIEELRWYLEDYLRAPYAVYEQHGRQVESRLPQWGEAAFAAVFRTPELLSAYRQVTADPAAARVVVRSSAPGWLALPWELLRDPRRAAPLALDIAGVDRSLVTSELGSSTDFVTSRLRVLMVISRAAGHGDVGYRMVARALLAQLEALPGGIDLVVLRPPTLDALAAALSAAAAEGNPFHVVHFDGHGTFADARHTAASLVFHKPAGGTDLVSASALAQVLRSARVPLVVLNACQSGAIGKQLEASLATRLLQEDVTAVVAMAFTVYATAAAEFMAAFYEQLFAGEAVSAAVAAGRRRLAQHSLRPSARGPMPLADWMIPVHYARADLRFTAPPGILPVPGSPSAALAGHPAGPLPAGNPLRTVDRFIGRDGLFYDLETAAWQQRPVILHGPAGAGKTELVKAFAQWWQQTGGVDRPEWVFWYSFEPGRVSFSLDNVVREIGLAVFGPDFALLNQQERLARVHEALSAHRMLLVWDNFESLRSRPGHGAASLTETAEPREPAETDEYRSFLRALGGGRSVLIVTSRSSEQWLGESHGPGTPQRIAVGGLAPEESAEFADHLLAASPTAASRRGQRAFEELMEVLDGHPFSMRLILPQLAATTAEALLDGLRGTSPLPGWDGEDEDQSPLPLSLSYSFGHLTGGSQSLLTAVALVQSLVDADLLAAFSQAAGVPRQFRRASRRKWIRSLDEAADAGLLTRLSPGTYQIHPLLPAYLSAQWRKARPGDYLAQRTAAVHALLDAYAGAGRWMIQQLSGPDAGLILADIDWHRRTMTSLLSVALELGKWLEGVALASPLFEYLLSRGEFTEALALARAGLAAVEERSGTAPVPGSTDDEIWLFFANQLGNISFILGDLRSAERTQREVLARMQAQPATPQQQQGTAGRLTNLGIVLQQQGQLDAAADLYRQALTIAGEYRFPQELANAYFQLGTLTYIRGDLAGADEWLTKALGVQGELPGPDIAVVYYQLGVVAQAQRKLTGALNWCTRALAVFEELGDRPKIAACYQELGLISQELAQLDQAVDWYIRALQVQEELGDRAAAADIYNQLGRVAQMRQRPDESREWFTKALTVREELGDRLGMVGNLHNLGTLAYQSADHAAAGDIFTRSIALAQEVGDRRALAAAYHQLGMIAQDAGQWDRARGWYDQSLAIEEELDNQPGIAGSALQIGILAQLRGHFDEAREWYRKSAEVSEAVGYPLGRMLAYGQLGLWEEAAGHPAEALESLIRAVTVLPDFSSPVGSEVVSQLARLTRQLGEPELRARWLAVTGAPLPAAVAEYVKAFNPL